MRTVSAADANRHFSKLLREVKSGQTVTITSRGKPVATVSPAGNDEPEGAAKARQEEWDAFLAELRAKPALNLGRITRDEIHDD